MSWHRDLNDGPITDDSADMSESVDKSGECRQGALDCEEILDMMYQYIDGELNQKQRLFVESHLGDCGPCFHELDFETKFLAVIAKKCSEEPPLELRDRIGTLLKGLNGTHKG